MKFFFKILYFWIKGGNIPWSLAYANAEWVGQIFVNATTEEEHKVTWVYSKTKIGLSMNTVTLSNPLQ